MSSDRTLAAVTALRAIHDELDACDLSTLNAADALTVLDALQDAECRAPAVRHRALGQLQQQSTPVEMGAKSWREVLATRWRLSGREAAHRLTHAALLAPRPTVTGGGPLAPTLEAVAAAQRLGFLTDEHVELLRKGIAKVPGWMTPTERDHLEVEWVRHAVGSGPKELKDQIERRLFLLDQDGPAPDDRERARRRSAILGPQQSDGMSVFTATLTPTARAVLEVLLAKFAAPGMCNPADDPPCLSGTPSQTQINADTRNPAQRQHDALETILRLALNKGELGHHNGLPTSILIRTTLADLMTLSGIATTGAGTALSIRDVVHLAARNNATSYLGIFDDATHQILDFYRARRTASVAQRLAIILRDGGCTKPGCPIHAYGTQVHHTVLDWSAGGNTNVNEMSLACGGDNRMVGPNGWTTTINEHHDTEWHPPPQLDTGQHRTNHYHHPERLRPPPNTTWTPPNPTEGVAEKPCASAQPEHHPTVDARAEAEIKDEDEIEVEVEVEDEIEDQAEDEDADESNAGNDSEATTMAHTTAEEATTPTTHTPGGSDPPLAA
jgi:hypothetical protein